MTQHTRDRIKRRPTAKELEAAGVVPSGDAMTDLRALDALRRAPARHAVLQAQVAAGDVLTYTPARDAANEYEAWPVPPPGPSRVHVVEGWA